MHELGEDGDFPGSWLLPMMSRGPRKSMMISAVLPGRSGFIRPRICFYAADIHGNLMTRQRISVLRHLMEDEGGVVVTTIDGLMDHLMPLAF